MGDIISFAKTVVYPRIERLIFEKVQKEREGNYPFRWEDSYSFHLTEYSVGGATVTVNATINVKNMGYYYQIKGKLDYDFYDKFTDPHDLLNITDSESDWPGATPFDITDHWSTYLEAVIVNESAA